MIEALSDNPYVSNDVEFSPQKLSTMILTGTNMGGKSSAAKSAYLSHTTDDKFAKAKLRMIALIAILAQIGSYVPAKACSTGIFDAVFTCVNRLS